MIKQRYMPTRSRPLSFTRFLVLAILAAFSGCASDALNLAPAAPDTPWKPAPQDTASSENTSGKLDMPLGFSVPVVPEASVLPAAPVINPGRVYGLPELIDIAQQENPDTRLAWNRARQAALAVGVVDSTFLPRLSANVISGWQKTHTPLPLLPGNHSINTEMHGVVPALALEWLIFDFGQRKAIAEGARQASFAANVLFNGSHQKIIHDVTHAYYQYGGAHSQTVVAAQALKNAHQIARAVEGRRKAGLATVLETAQANQQVAQAKLRQVTAQGNQQIAYQALLAAVGLPATMDIKISPPPKHALPGTNSTLTDEAIRMAISRRPDVLASYAAMKASAQGITAAKAEFLPKVYLGAVAARSHTNFDVRGLPSLSQQTGSSSVILGVTIPIFDGGLRSARLQDARIQAASAADVFQKSQQAAMREMIAASDMLRTALASYQAASELVRTAKTTYDGALEAYRHGLGTLTAVTMADTALLDAQQARMDARTASQAAAANLAFVMGDMTTARESWVGQDVLTRPGLAGDFQ
ncbi:MAG: TolC family protein [Advenella sp.]|nr:TolC family protein [Advenella sp.]